MFFVPALPPPPHTFLPGFERIKKLVQNKSGGGVRTPHSPPWLRHWLQLKENQTDLRISPFLFKG